MKPDLGASLYLRGIGPAVRLCYYGVRIDHISVTNTHLLTTMVNRVEDGVEYAVSFDFTDDAAVELVACLDARVIERLEVAAEDVHTAGLTLELDAPVLVDIEASLGPLQISPTEAFAPLIVHRVK